MEETQQTSTDPPVSDIREEPMEDAGQPSEVPTGSFTFDSNANSHTSTGGLALPPAPSPATAFAWRTIAPQPPGPSSGSNADSHRSTGGLVLPPAVAPQPPAPFSGSNAGSHITIGSTVGLALPPAVAPQPIAPSSGSNAGSHTNIGRGPGGLALPPAPGPGTTPPGGFPVVDWSTYQPPPPSTRPPNVDPNPSSQRLFTDTNPSQFDENGNLRVVPQARPPPPQPQSDPIPRPGTSPANPRKILRPRGPLARSQGIAANSSSGGPSADGQQGQATSSQQLEYNASERAPLDAFGRRTGLAQSEGQSNPAPSQSQGYVRTRHHNSTRANPHTATHLAPNQRIRNILDALRAANHLILQWDEDTYMGDIMRLYSDPNSVLNDLWENIREVEAFFTRAQKVNNRSTPENYELDVLQEMENEVDALVSHLIELIDPQSTNYDIYLDCFEDTLEEARSIQVVLKDAIAKNIAKNTPAPSRQFKSYRANPLESMQNATQRDSSILDALYRANQLFKQWSEDTEEGDIMPLHKDGSSGLHDHYENIRWVWEFLVNCKVLAEPAHFSKAVLDEIKEELDALVSQLAELTDGESVMYDTYILFFETTLAQARRMQDILEDAVFWQDTLLLHAKETSD